MLQYVFESNHGAEFGIGKANRTRQMKHLSFLLEYSSPNEAFTIKNYLVSVICSIIFCWRSANPKSVSCLVSCLSFFASIHLEMHRHAFTHGRPQTTWKLVVIFFSFPWKWCWCWCWWRWENALDLLLQECHVLLLRLSAVSSVLSFSLSLSLFVYYYHPPIRIPIYILPLLTWFCVCSF